ncbi:hypothetical protein TBLA_0A08280 [Henningerozyma blattae CBS 6284]|uniref:EF-hand domain-containing protein n=1 Tax=Henningerozyma blattae (strain ATCC 34711 / CBS 6284 / DSM 70876 / NBRC 10599 / NRRL Y-10934 / UCD 77-7) TaxID=1071380 RepID=I2GWW5_HENB6|nr:hypothetical protein TBLA_0A08280 [Tetrapisispora blattae CBS 6284]CCH58617.1 hypothetical protein TBLA_0A08280 [Tetrapisispora blattae CBS 6284]
MGRKRVTYSAGDNLELYQTPEEIVQESEKKKEEEELRRFMQHNMKSPHGSNSSLGTQNPTTLRDDNYSHASPSTQSSMNSPHHHHHNHHHSHHQMPTQNHKIPNDLSHNVKNTKSQSPPPVTFPQQRSRVPPPPIGIPPSIPSASRKPVASVASTPAIHNNTNSRHQEMSSIGQNRDAKSTKDAKDTNFAVQLFITHDTRKRGQLTADDLQNILQNDDSSQFCQSTTEALVDLFGVSRFGVVIQEEFVSLYKKVKYWRKIYVDNDINGSHTITMGEFHNSLLEMGYVLPSEVSEKLFDRYARFVNHESDLRAMKFDRFVESLLWLTRLTKVFRKYDANQEGIATIHYKDFIDCTLLLGRFLPR